ncbi:macrophage mannose receptor 1-like [Astyanax mexicanus]|uniref:macrophage mannose receptor 1-like n=1 Tax=Astyanax mexicanus TaxID=7994 RepID=UPI0020CAC4BE|nr:macrophage mannose receptor 1-like [Astyanax mexicanus]
MECSRNYTNLVTIHNESQNAELINLTNTLLPANSKVWIGLKRSNYSFKWSNGDNVNKFKNLSGSCWKMPCCAAMITNGSWINMLCTEKRNFMCYKQDQTEHNYSYHLITENKTWYEAQSYCKNRFTDLVSIRDQEQNEKVRKEGMKSSTLFWIGLLRDDWQWADGGRSAYRNWGAGEPRPSTTTSDCTQLKNGTWQAVTCSSKVDAVMCYRATESRNRTFHLLVKNMNQSEARAACRENYTDLATVHNDIENAELINQINTSDKLSENSKVWIGLQRSNYSFKWSNGDNDNKLKNLFGSCWKMPCCAAMMADASWDNITCTETRNFMCYKQVNLTSVSYHLITDQSKTWYKAQNFCRSIYTDLVSIKDQVQNVEVMKAGMNSSTPFWIGLLHDDWEWADGGRSAYRNWEDGQPRPSSSSSSSNCTQLNVNGKWQTVPCSNVVEAIMCY